MEEAIWAAHDLYERRLAEFANASARVSDKKASDPHYRAALAYHIWRSGKTYKEVGAELGCSGARARQLVQLFLRKKAMSEALPESNELSVRALNALELAGLSPSDHVSIMQFGASKFRSLPNVGNVTIAEIAQWLAGKGFILQR